MAIRKKIAIYFLVTLTLLNKEGFSIINRRCATKKNMVCTNIRNCEYLSDLLKTELTPRPPHAIQFIRQNHCGKKRNTRKVCCNVTKLNDFNNVNTKKHPNTKLLPINNCGTNQVMMSSRIVGGSKTFPSEYPWMALLAYNSITNPEFKCAGTVINERYVLTAAHCVANEIPIGVRLGEHNINKKLDCDILEMICAPPVQDFYIEKVIVHSKYTPKYSANDIALIRLAALANFKRKNVAPICLPTDEFSNINLEGKYVTVAGWGVTENDYRSTVLLKVSLRVIKTKKCKNIYRRFKPVTAKQICAGGYSGKDSCRGDSGGPLKYVVFENGVSRHVQFGIVSYGPKDCGAEGQPGVYVSVAHYMKWILNNLEPTEED